MATNPGSYGSTNTTATPAAPATPASSPVASVAAGSFPQTPTGQGLGTNGIPVANISVADFLANYGISTTEESTYVSADSKGQPALNQNALFLMQYKAMSPTEREDLQQSMVNAGLLPQGDANGINNSAALGAFKSSIANAAASGVQVDEYLQQYSGTNNVNQALAKATAGAQAESQAPTVVNETNPTTLDADLVQAFDQTLGYASSPAQQAAFVAAYHAQEVSNQQAPHEAAAAQLAQLKSDQSALSKLGSNGIDAVITAYTNAIHGINPAAGNSANPQGPANGSVVQPGQPGTMGPMGPAGAPTIIPGQTPSFNVGGIKDALLGSTTPVQSPTSMLTTEKPGSAPSAPQWQPGPGAKTNPTFGGYYALTPADWTEAKKLYPQAAKFATAGSAPVAVQHAAFTTLLQNVYDNNGGSWADAIVTIAGGTVGKAGSEKELGSVNLQTFATGIAQQVNDQLDQLTNSINTNNITEKTTAPDATAEANLAAKSADPVGYTAANAATAGSLLNQMLAGAPQMYGQTTADTFTGPAVAAGAETSSTAVA